MIEPHPPNLQVISKISAEDVVITPFLCHAWLDHRKEIASSARLIGTALKRGFEL